MIGREMQSSPLIGPEQQCSPLIGPGPGDHGAEAGAGQDQAGPAEDEVTAPEPGHAQQQRRGGRGK